MAEKSEATKPPAVPVEEAKKPVVSAWGAGIITHKDQVFKKASTVAMHKTGLKVLIFGETDTMKTGFALSAVKAAPPVFDFDTELGAPPLFIHFTKEELDQIDWCDATFLDPKSDLPDPLVMLQKLESSITAIKEFTDNVTPEKPIAGTVVIDSLTDVWDWIQEWLEGVGVKKKGTLLRFNWPKARHRIKKLIFRLIAKPVHLICTAHPQVIYVGSEATDRFRPRVEKALPHRFDLVIHAKRFEVPGAPVQYKAYVTKCRFKKGWRPEFTDITFKKVLDKLQEDLGVQVW